jgi:uncharacterized protein
MTRETIVTINSRKFDGSLRRSWTCRLARRDGALLVFEGVFDIEVLHPELGTISRGTTSYEYYWLDRWYNIFRFHEPDGPLRNYYCNINLPPELDGETLNYVDLDIDVLVWPDNTYEVLDIDEFEANALKFKYPAAVRSGASNALAQVIKLIERSGLPDD